MARIRTIKPDFFTSLTICSMPLRARLTFVGLWTHVDDAGRCVDDVRLIRAAIWPLDDWTLADVEDDLKEIAGKGLAVRYEADNRHYLAVRGFSEHQRINKPTPTKLPDPPRSEDSGTTPVVLPEYSRNTPTPLLHDSPPERKGMEGNGSEGSNPSRAGAREPVANHDHPNGSIPKIDDGLTEDERLRRRWQGTGCPEHRGPSIANCYECGIEHRDHRYWTRHDYAVRSST